MLQYIKELREIDGLVVSSCPLPPHVNDMRFTTGERNKKPLASPYINFSWCGTWGPPNHIIAVVNLTLTMHKN